MATRQQSFKSPTGHLEREATPLHLTNGMGEARGQWLRTRDAAVYCGRSVKGFRAWAEAVYQMERGLRRFPVERLFSDDLLADVDAQRFADALIRAMAEAWGVEDRDGIARQLRLLTVAVEKRMAKADVPLMAAERKRA